MDHKDLRDDYEELLSALRRELDEERQLREVAGRVREEAARLEAAVDGMPAAEVRSLRADLLPALAAQLEAIGERDAAADWRHVEREWPADAAPDALRPLLRRVDEAAGEREARAVDEDAWAERRRQLDAQLAATDPNEEPAAVERRLARHAEMLAEAAEWLRASRLPDRDALAAQLREEAEKTAARRQELAELAVRQHAADEWLQRRQELESALLEVDNRVGELNAAQPEDAARIDEAAADVERVRAQVAAQEEWARGEDALPADQRAAALEQLRAEAGRLERHTDDLAALRRRLQLAEKLAALRALLETARATEKPEVRRSQLDAIREELPTETTEEIAGLRAEVDEAIEEAEREERVRRLDEDVGRAAALEPPEARARLTAVRAELAALPAEDAARLQSTVERAERVLAVEQEVAAERERLLEDVRAAEEQLAAPDASVGELRRSAELLRTAAPRLEAIGRAYEQLEDDDEQTAATRARVADQLAALGELFRNTQQAARDRVADARRQQHARLAAAVHAAQAVLAAPDARPEQYAEQVALLEHAVQQEGEDAHREEATEGEEEDAALADLRRLVQVAAETRRAADERADAWREFRRRRDLIGDRHEAARQLHENVQRAARRPAAQVEADRDILQTALANQVEPVGADLEALAELAGRLEPLGVAESELRFVEMDHKDLRDDYEELLGALRRELDEERQLREAAGRVREEAARLEAAVDGMPAAEVRSLRADLLPALAAQLEAIGERDAAADWRHVEREWPADAAPDALRSLLGRVDEAAGEREARAVDEDAWAERRRQLDAHLAATDPNEEPAAVERRLARHAEMLAEAAECLRASRLPDRDALAAQLREEAEKTAARRQELADLAAHQQEALELQKTFAEQHAALSDFLAESIRPLAEFTHKPARPVEEVERDNRELIRLYASPEVSPFARARSELAALREMVARLDDAEATRSLDALERDVQQAEDEWTEVSGQLAAELEQELRLQRAESDLNTRLSENSARPLEEQREFVAHELPALQRRVDELAAESDRAAPQRRFVTRAAAQPTGESVHEEIRALIAQTEMRLQAAELREQLPQLRALLDAARRPLDELRGHTPASTQQAEEDVLRLKETQPSLDLFDHKLQAVRPVADRLPDAEVREQLDRLEAEWRQLADERADVEGALMVELEEELQLQQAAERLDRQLAEVDVAAVSPERLAKLRAEADALAAQSNAAAPTRRFVRRETAERPDERVERLEQDAARVRDFRKQQEAVESLLAAVQRPLHEIADRGLRTAPQAEEDVKQLTEAIPLLSDLDDELERLHALAAAVPSEGPRVAAADLQEQSRQAHDRYGDLSGRLMVELEEELQLREAEKRVADCLLVRVEEMPAEELRRLRSELLPQLRDEARSLQEQTAAAANSREFVRRSEEPNEQREDAQSITNILHKIDELEEAAGRKAAEEERAAEWGEKQRELDAAAQPLLQSAAQLLERSADAPPLPLAALRNDEQTAARLYERLEEAEGRAVEAVEWLERAGELAEEQRQAAFAEETERVEAIRAQRAALRELEPRLAAAVRQHEELAADVAALRADFHAAAPERPAAADDLPRIEQLEAQLTPFVHRLQALRTAAQPLAEPPAELEDVGREIEQLHTRVQNAKHDRLVQIDADLSAEIQQLQHTIAEAERVQSRPDASLDELQRVAELLTTVKPRLEAVCQLEAAIQPDHSAQLALLNAVFDGIRDAVDRRVLAVYSAATDELVQAVNAASAQLDEPNARPEDAADVRERLQHASSAAQPLVHSPFDLPPDAQARAAELARALELAADFERRLEQRDADMAAFLAQRDVVPDSVLRFLGEALAQLPADLEETAAELRAELDDEEALSRRYDALVARINELPTGAVEKAELQRLQSAVLPPLRDDAVALMDATAHSAAARRHVLASQTPVDKLLDVIADLGAQLHDKLLKAEEREPSEPPASSEWGARKAEAEQTVAAAIADAEALLTPFAQGQPPQSLERAEETLGAIPARVDELRRARDLVDAQIAWILESTQLKPNKREANAKQLRRLQRSLDDKTTDLDELQTKLAEDARRQRQVAAALAELERIEADARALPDSPEEKLKKLEELEHCLHELDTTARSEEHEVAPLIRPAAQQDELRTKASEIAALLARERVATGQQPTEVITRTEVVEVVQKPADQPADEPDEQTKEVELPPTAHKLTARIETAAPPDAAASTSAPPDEIDAAAIIGEVSPEYDGRPPKQQILDALQQAAALLQQKEAADEEDVQRTVRLLLSLQPQLQAVRLEVQALAKDKKGRKQAKEREREFIRLEADVQKSRAALEKLRGKKEKPPAEQKNAEEPKEVETVVRVEVVEETTTLVIPPPAVDVQQPAISELSATPDLESTEFVRTERPEETRVHQPTAPAIEQAEAARIEQPSAPIADLPLTSDVETTELVRIERQDVQPTAPAMEQPTAPIGELSAASELPSTEFSPPLIGR
ncbi:hypothetical protein M3Y99_00376900 [Aphelenchoides fujianensis]|nr:hypothetical protein M3Y99_00376900 [Aphelenchoides fujianensis]